MGDVITHSDDGAASRSHPMFLQMIPRSTNQNRYIRCFPDSPTRRCAAQHTHAPRACLPCLTLDADDLLLTPRLTQCTARVRLTRAYWRGPHLRARAHLREE